MFCCSVPVWAAASGGGVVTGWSRAGSAVPQAALTTERTESWLLLAHPLDVASKTVAACKRRPGFAL